MRNWISGIVGVVWGGLIVLRALFVVGLPTGDGALMTGYLIGVGIGVLMFLAGIYYIVKAINEPAVTKKKSKKGTGKRKVRQSEEE